MASHATFTTSSHVQVLPRPPVEGSSNIPFSRYTSANTTLSVGEGARGGHPEFKYIYVYFLFSPTGLHARKSTQLPQLVELEPWSSYVDTIHCTHVDVIQSISNFSSMQLYRTHQQNPINKARAESMAEIINPTPPPKALFMGQFTCHTC